MKYTVNWVEKNLGLTRKVLRIYEHKGLMDKSTFQNPDNKYREYSEEDIERIWCYRMLQSIGYSLNDIVEMKQNDEFDFQNSITEKISDLESRKVEIEQHIGFAKTIKLLGSFPYPIEMGSIRFDDFMKIVRNNWNINTDSKMALAQTLVKNIVNKTEPIDTVVSQFETLLDGINMEDLLLLNEYYNGMLEHKELGSSHHVIQTHAYLIYKFYLDHFPSLGLRDVTKQDFARVVIYPFIAGDLAAENERIYGRDGCKFIVETFEYFSEHSSGSETD